MISGFDAVVWSAFEICWTDVGMIWLNVMLVIEFYMIFIKDVYFCCY